MSKKIVLIMFALLLCKFTDATGQSLVRCALPQLSDQEVQAIRSDIDQYLQLGKYSGISETIIVPVAFHIIRHDDGSHNVTDQQINDQINALNGAYSNSNFQFILHSIDRVNNTEWSTQSYSTSPGSEEVAMKEALAISPETVLNFYTISNNQYLGWARFPWDYPETSKMHGVICYYESLPGGEEYPYDQGHTGTHEIGHYLGLFHTFQGGCSATGDDVDDTPAQDDGNNVFDCNENLDTCPSDPGNDPVHNYMNYTDDYCMDNFSIGQSDRMDVIVSKYKPSLVGVAVLVDQRKEDGSSFGSVGRWETDDFVNYPVPKTFTFQSGETEVMRASQARVSSPDQKYNEWTGFNDVENHRPFEISAGLSLIAQFDFTKENVVITNDLEAIGEQNTGYVFFKDPWLIDYADPNYGNNERNQGLSAPFKQRQSPFSPDYSTDYDGDVYQGVFLDQPYTGDNPVYYSVRAEELQQATVHGSEMVDWYFQRWGGTAVDYKSPESKETAVVFTAPNAEARAIYRGNHLSNISNATGANNGRRIVRESPTKLHMVYSDDAGLYYSYSTDNGATWSKDTEILSGSADFGDQELNPSIAIINDQLYTTWTEKIVNPDSTWYHIYVSNIPLNGGSWAPDMLIAKQNINSSTVPTPVITSHNGFIIMCGSA